MSPDRLRDPGCCYGRRSRGSSSPGRSRVGRRRDWSFVDTEVGQRGAAGLDFPAPGRDPGRDFDADGLAWFRVGAGLFRFGWGGWERSGSLAGGLVAHRCVADGCGVFDRRRVVVLGWAASAEDPAAGWECRVVVWDTVLAHALGEVEQRALLLLGYGRVSGESVAERLAVLFCGLEGYVSIGQTLREGSRAAVRPGGRCVAMGASFRRAPCGEPGFTRWRVTRALRRLLTGRYRRSGILGAMILFDRAAAVERWAPDARRCR